MIIIGCDYHPGFQQCIGLNRLDAAGAMGIESEGRWWEGDGPRQRGAMVESQVTQEKGLMAG